MWISLNLVSGAWLIEQFRTIGVCVTQKVIPTGGSLLLDTFRTGDFAVALESYCQDVVNPIADISRYLPHKVQSVNFAYHDDAKLVGLYDQMLRATDPTKARVLMREFERQVIDVGAHQLPVTGGTRILPIRSVDVKGWNIASSHYLNQNLANIWLDR